MNKKKLLYFKISLKVFSCKHYLPAFLLSLFKFQIANSLFLVALFPLLGSLFLIFFFKSDRASFKKVGFNISSVSLFLTLFLIGNFNRFTGTFQYVEHLCWLPVLNLNVSLGVDGISLFFVLLVTFLTPVCLLLCWGNDFVSVKNNFILILFLEFVLINVFCTLDVFMFYVFFESSLIPMFLIIGLTGSRERRILASYYFFLFTLAGSVLMLLALAYIYYQVGTTNYEVLLSFKFSLLEQKILWAAFFMSFASKVPMMPFHLWLPEAHVEAPTAGSVLLAGVLLKLGTYGFIRFSLPLFPQASFYFSPLVYTLAVVGMIHSSLTAMRQSDIKRIIAYTSIAHMNVVIVGIFSLNVLSLEGALLQCISHGFVASALFISIGVIYERHNTRLVKYYGGLVPGNPMLATVKKRKKKE